MNSGMMVQSRDQVLIGSLFMPCLIDLRGKPLIDVRAFLERPAHESQSPGS